MPTYEYRCTDCGENLEVVQSFSDEPLTVCPACQGTLRKLFSAVGVVFKGSGFYKTDSRSGKSTSSTNASSSSSGSSPDKSDSAAASNGDKKSESSTASAGGSAAASSSGGSDSTGGGSKVA